MKTILVLSDSHGNRSAIAKLYPLMQENDYIFHLGDGNLDMAEVVQAFPNKTFVCQGNCDGSTPYSKKEMEITIENVKFLLCHGHAYGVKYTLENYAKECKERRAKVGLYGHTHIAKIETVDGVIMMNPGNLSPFSTDPSYGYIVVNGDKVTATTVPIY